MTAEDTSLVAFIDDDVVLRAASVQTLELAGFAVSPFSSAESALKAIDRDFPGVVVSDIRMPRMDGHQLFRRLRERDPDLPVLLITGHGDIPEAVQALQEGAYDFIAKPYSSERLLSSVSRALEKRRLVLDNRRLRALAGRAEADSNLVGETAVMDTLRSTIRQIADADVDVLVEGETGVGKEMVARALHRASGRRGRPFLIVNCAALPEAMIESELFGHEAGAFSGAARRRVGRIEAADRGTLVLDGVDSMPVAMQGKLLRVLEQREVAPLGTNELRPVDIRVVATANVDLSQAVARGDFRADLFYRLNVVRIRVPALRERRDDIPLLFSHFLAEASRRARREPPVLTEAVRSRLLEGDWPGNVRELCHFAERVALGIEASTGSGQAAEPLSTKCDAYEARLIREALAANGGDVRTTIETLSIPRKTFYDKVKRHDINLDSFRSQENARRRRQPADQG